MADFSNVQMSLQRGAGAIQNNKYISAITNGLMSAMPITIVGALGSLVNSFPVQGYQDFLVNTGLKAKDENTAITYHLFTWGQSNWQTWRISALSTMNAALRVSISRGRSNQSRSMLSLKSWRWLAYRRRNYTKVSPTGSRRTGTTTCNGSANRPNAGKP